MPNSNYLLEKEKIKSCLVFGNDKENEITLSIVIPTYKRVDLLRKNLKAILSQNIPQNPVNYEVVVVANDPNFDYKSLNLELDHNIFKIYVNEENLGMCGNMNRCILLAKGTYISYIQDDDVLLPNYLEEISSLICTGKLNSIDWLIPNRYYLMPDTGKKTQFGKKAKRNMVLKRVIGWMIRLGRPISMYQKITPYETLITTYPFYAGGPTCGMVFKKQSLLNSGGFNSSYPYGFDYVFFIEFSKKFNVELYNKYLSLYMTSDSASNSPKVQYDFFRARYDTLESNAKEYGIDEKKKRIILFLTYVGYPVETREMVDKDCKIERVSRVIALGNKLLCMLRTYKSGGYRRMPCPKAFEEWYNNL